MPPNSMLVLNKSAEFISSCPLWKCYVVLWCTLSPLLHLVSLLFEPVHQNPLGYEIEEEEKQRDGTNEQKKKQMESKEKVKNISYLLSFWKGLLDKLKAVIYSNWV